MLRGSLSRAIVVPSAAQDRGEGVTTPRRAREVQIALAVRLPSTGHEAHPALERVRPSQNGAAEPIRYGNPQARGWRAIMAARKKSSAAPTGARCTNGAQVASDALAKHVKDLFAAHGVMQTARLACTAREVVLRVAAQQPVRPGTLLHVARTLNFTDLDRVAA